MQFDTQSLWLYIDFPALQLNVIEQSQTRDVSEATKAQENKARAIYQSSNNQIVQINQAAFDRGIRLGMGLAKASMLLSDLQLHEYNASIEENSIEQLAQHLYLVSSDIALAPPRGLILRVQNMLHLYGGLKPYWRILEYCLNQQNYQFHAACAYSIQAAKLLALHGKSLISDERQQIQQALEKCSINVSDIDTKDIEKLNRIGVASVKELQAIPAADIANRVSRFSMNIVNELRGQSPAKVKFFQPSTEFHDYIELLYEIDNTDKLLPVIKRCLKKLEHFLYVRNARCLQIKIDFFQREHPALKLNFDSALPIYRSQEWLDIIALRLERSKLESPVYGLELHCIRYEITPITNDDLFEKKSHHIAGLSLISRLISKLGDDKVKGLEYRADFRPEYSSCLVPIGKAHRQQAHQVKVDRPGILLAQPQLLSKEVSVIKGPERIVSGWWDDQQILRDYYIGQSQDGQQVWVYKTPNNQWYLHGYFV